MGLSLTKNKDMVFTIFENDQVLTADQLNDLFAYLDVQDRLSRVKTLGTGIVCGLKIRRKGNIISLSKGAAITTDGDLLHYNQGLTFNAYVVFKDDNAKYPALQKDEVIYQLLENVEDHRDAAPLKDFKSNEGENLSKYVALLYLEDYINDPDLCTGIDCDNKGAIAVKNQRVLLVPESMIKDLRLNAPVQQFFDLQDIHVPRVVLNPDTTTRTKLDAAFKTTFGVRKALQENLAKAFKLCAPILGDVFDDNPNASWKTSLDGFFGESKLANRQYLYNFLCDLAEAYNELKDSLLGERAFCVPDFDFSKHVLLGNLKETKEELKRFTVEKHVNNEDRHQFYASPILNKGEENVQKIKFMFMRIHAMISNFVFPENNQIKITPSYLKDSKLGEKSIPYYYKYDENLPINLYWDYEAHVKHKENQISYFHAEQYPEKSEKVLNPLNFNILEYDFFKIEGFVGMRYHDAEEKIEQIIEENNLPIRIMSLQLERNFVTLPIKKWKFPYLQVNDYFLKKSLSDHLEQSVKIQDDLIKKYIPQQEDDPPKPIMDSTFNTFKDRKAQIDNELKQGSLAERIQFIKPAFDATISAATEVKVKTSNFSFSGTSLPHDFLINTDVISKADLLKDLLDKKVASKKEDLILGNFIKKNPGIENASGVIRGGTFVLVYTSSDKKVVAGFMLPYNYVDQDLREELPEPTPGPVILPKFDIDKLYLPKPPYVNVVEKRYKDLDVKINDNYKILQADLGQKANLSVLETINTNQNQVFSNVINTLSGISSEFKTVYQNINTSQNQLLGSVVNAFSGISANISTMKTEQVVKDTPVLYGTFEEDLKHYTDETDVQRKGQIASDIEKNLMTEIENKEFNLKNPDDVSVLLELSKAVKDLPDDISKNLTTQIMTKIIK